MIIDTTTLGYHRDMCTFVFGEDSKATKFLDEKIATDPDGRDGVVFADETQMVHLLMQVHLGNPTEENIS